MRLVGSIGLKSEPEMEQEFEDALRFFDKDGRGLINAQHLKSALQSYGEPLETEDLNELIRMADVKGDGKIDYLGICLTDDFCDRTVYYRGLFRRTLAPGSPYRYEDILGVSIHIGYTNVQTCVVVCEYVSTTKRS